MELVASRKLASAWRNRSWLLFTAALFALSPGGARAAIPRGIFSLQAAGLYTVPVVLTNPDVIGVSVRQNWSDLEPSEGVYNFAYLDAEIALAAGAGKQVLLRINSQATKPAWVTTAVQTAGGTFFSFKTGGTTMTIPVFWDPTYLAKKKDMIMALGARYANNPAVTVVSASFANAISEDWDVPHTPPDITNWFAAGYTTDNLLSAGQQIIDTTMAAFPNQYVCLAIAGDGHFDSLTNLDPTATYAAAAAIATANSSWPGRLVVQINSLSTTIQVAPGATDTAWNLLWNSKPNVAAQMVGNVAGDSTYQANGGVPGDAGTILTTCINDGLSYGANYLEIYQIDVTTLPAVITYAQQQLTATIPPFRLDGVADAPGYLQDNSGLPLYAAVRGGMLYVATTSPGSDNEPNDNFIFVTDNLLPSAVGPAPMAKLGFVATDPLKPYLFSNNTISGTNWTNASLSALGIKSPTSSGQMEGTIDLAATFGVVPDTIYLAAASYGTGTGGALTAQGPIGNGDGNIDPAEFLPLSVVALADENADGVYDRLDPAIDFVVSDVSRLNGVTSVTWASVPGKTYQLESCDHLGDSWTPLNLPMMAGTGQLTLTCTDVTSVPTRFYYVRIVSP